MSTETVNKSRFPELDFLRAVAVIAVIAIHVTSITLIKTDPDHFTRLSSLLINQLSRFCVPAFLFVSGILAYHSFHRSTYSQLIVSKVKALIIPYVVWTLIGLLFFLSFSINYKGIIMIFLTGNGPFYQLYYIPLLFQMFVILPLIMRFMLNRFILIVISLLSCFLFIGYQFMIIESVHTMSLIGYVSSFLQSAFFGWIIYFYIGLLAAKNYPSVLKFLQSKSLAFFVMIYVICSILLVTDAYYSIIIHKQDELMGYFRISVLVYSFAALGLIIKLGMISKWKIMTNLYQNSFGIYLIHVAVLKLMFLISSVLFSNLIYVTASIVLTIVISYWIVELIKRTPLSFLLLGQKSMSTKRHSSMKPRDKKMVS
ncbi:acyltransferase [Paenibacillus sp. N3.4]|uniref:acyltransferase n=1 Tax=Paenibacillus sp. N3.4 TaxID=2603222 RepID=UPI0016506BCD|nr:acyltransferase [Paenibacillus sp. N3.4]